MFECVCVCVCTTIGVQMQQTTGGFLGENYLIFELFILDLDKYWTIEVSYLNIELRLAVAYHVESLK